MDYLLKGMFIGIVFGLPAGVIGALTIQRTIERGFLYGFITGLGSTAADMIYASMGIFGLRIISDFLLEYRERFRAFGGILIILFGIFSIFQKKKRQKEEKKNGYVAAFISSFALAFTNPAAILSFLAVFSSMGITVGYQAYEGILLVVGIGAGTVCWWALLSFGTEHLRNRVTEKIYQRLHIVLGFIMIGFGIFVMIV